MEDREKSDTDAKEKVKQFHAVLALINEKLSEIKKLKGEQSQSPKNAPLNPQSVILIRTIQSYEEAAKQAIQLLTQFYDKSNDYNKETKQHEMPANVKEEIKKEFIKNPLEEFEKEVVKQLFSSNDRSDAFFNAIKKPAPPSGPKPRPLNPPTEAKQKRPLPNPPTKESEEPSSTNLDEQTGSKPRKGF